MHPISHDLSFNEPSWNVGILLNTAFQEVRPIPCTESSAPIVCLSLYLCPLSRNFAFFPTFPCLDHVLSHFRHVRLFAILWTVAHQAPRSMRFSRQEYWSELLLPTPGDLPNPGMEPTSLVSPALTGRFFPASATWESPLLTVGWDTWLALASGIILNWYKRRLQHAFVIILLPHSIDQRGQGPSGKRLQGEIMETGKS